MEKKEQVRLVIALALSAAVLFGWQYIMAPSAEEQAEMARKAAEAEQKTAALTQQQAPAAQAAADAAPAAESTPTAGTPVTVDTPLYTATFNSQGGILEKFVLKNYRETIKAGSPNVDLIGKNAFATVMKLDIGVDDGDTMSISYEGRLGKITQFGSIAFFSGQISPKGFRKLDFNGSGNAWHKSSYIRG